MRSQVSANAENSSNRKAGGRLKSKKAAVVFLIIAGVSLVVFYLLLSRFMSIALSAILQQKVNIGKVSISNGLRLQDVSIDGEGLFLYVEELLVRVKLYPIDEAGVEEVILNRPLLYISDRDVRNVRKLISPTIFPTITVNQGRLMLRDGFSSLFHELSAPSVRTPFRNESLTGQACSGRACSTKAKQALPLQLTYAKRKFPYNQGKISPSPFPLPQGERIKVRGLKFRYLEIINLNYLKLNAFASGDNFGAEVFADVEFQGKKMPAKFSGKAFLAGSIRNPKINIRIYPSDFQLGDFPVRDFTGCVKLNRGKFSVTEICGTLFDGVLNGCVKADLEKKEYLLECEISKLNLGELVRKLNFSRKDVSGNVDIQLSLSAAGEGLESLSGNGSVKITDGKLWKVPVLYGLRTLILMPAFRGAVFSEGGCDFKIGKRMFSTNNLRLTSEDVGLAADGRLGFDGGLDFIVTTVFTREFMARTPEVIKITSLLSRILDFFIVRYHIGGRLSEPSYELIPIPVITTIPLQIKRIFEILFGKQDAMTGRPQGSPLRKKGNSKQAKASKHAKQG